MLTVAQHNGIQELSGVVENDDDLAQVAKALDSDVKEDIWSPFEGGTTRIKYVANTTIDQFTGHIRSSWVVIGCWVWLQFTTERPLAAVPNVEETDS